MILPVVLIALLLCAESGAKQAVKECSDWACFTPKACLEQPGKGIFVIDQDFLIIDDCASILLIKPLSLSQWTVVLESWSDSATEVKVMHGTNELFSCAKGSSKASSGVFTDLSESEPFSQKPISCQFTVGDGTTEVLKDSSQKIKLISLPDGAENDVEDSSFLSDVKKKIRCDRSHIQFEETASAEETVKPAFVEFLSVTCSESGYKLQYKTGSAYEDSVGGITCAKVSDDKYQYKTSTDTIIPAAPFHARCYAKVCSFCSSPPLTPASSEAPTLGEDAATGCKTLTCPKYFKIDGDISKESAVCTKSGDEFKWTIGEKTIEATTNVECATEIPCAKLTKGCSEKPCTLNATTGLPYCPATHTLSATINDDKLENVTFSCNRESGKLIYSVDKDSTRELPDDSSKFSFSCEAVAASPSVAAAGSIPGSLQACLTVGAVLSLILIAGSVAMWIWKRRQREAQQVEKAYEKAKGSSGEAKEKGSGEAKGSSKDKGSGEAKEGKKAAEEN